MVRNNIEIIDEENEGLKMTFYLNDWGRLFLTCGDVDSFEFNNYITLSKDDVIAVIEKLSELVKEMENG